MPLERPRQTFEGSRVNENAIKLQIYAAAIAYDPAYRAKARRSFTTNSKRWDMRFTPTIFAKFLEPIDRRRC